MSEVKVNKISPRSGTEVTLGDSGDTFTIPSGATINNQGTATNFGATGSASWVTTVKTSTFTAVAGEGYFVNTTGGAVTVNLPAGTAGAVVAVKDYAGTFDANACTLVQNGSDKVGGSTVNPILSTEGLAITLVFIDSTQGWLVTDNGTQDTAPTVRYVTATGGSIATCGNFKIHTFTGPGSFAVSCAGNACGSNSVDYMVVAGGAGGGGWNTAGGGGAGGFRESPGTASGSYTVSPLGAAPAAALSVPVQSYPVVVGGGGGGGPGGGGSGCGGNNSSFSTITSAGGGAGSGQDTNGDPGGSGGGGGGGGGPGNSTGGTGNTPPVNPAQGKDGGSNVRGGNPAEGGGGGGAGAVGGPGGGPNPGPSRPTRNGGPGGAGVTTNISGSPVARAGGGAGAGHAAGQPGGTGGGGPGGADNNPGTGGAGTINTGGGGGGGKDTTGGAGGSGIVIIRYKFQN